MIDNSKSTPELISEAYKNDVEEEYWGIIHELHKRGSEVEFSAACKLIESTDPINREIGADILGQIGWRDNSFQDESIPILIRLLADGCDDVIASAAFSLGHRNSPMAIPILIELATHNSARVREGVVSGLSGLESEAAINTLITLSRDPEVDVRNWATFGIGNLSEADNSDIRNALKERITDNDYEVRGEAFIGLANRKVIEIQDALIKELSGEFSGNWAVEAAKIMADPAYCRVLSKLKSREAGNIEDRFINDIDEAISCCCGDSKT
ncbi:MAG: HEAT repeat domain-containing protein [Gammaproteobacteria bacterium]|nr:HEAT repeat domain-containing protein [Gammaproteobacteria bacterium]